MKQTSTVWTLRGLKFLSPLLLCAAMVTTVSAETVSDSVAIHFRQSRTELDTIYLNNAESLQGIRKRLQDLRDNKREANLKAVRVSGGASPEGSVKFNEWLSHERANRIFDYLAKTENLPSSQTDFKFKGRDWSGLKKLVEEDYKVPYRQEVLALLDEILINVASGESEAAGNVAKLKRLRKRVPYDYLYKNIFPRLREARLMLVYYIPEDEPIPLPDPQPGYIIEPEPEPEPEPIVVEEPTVTIAPAPVEKAPFYMDVRTDLLYDIAALPGIGIDFWLGKGWSVGANWTYGWWRSDRRHRYWRAYGGDINVRKWLGKKAQETPLTGHHIGLYAQVLTYDFEFGAKGYMGGMPGGNIFDRCHLGAGIDYGYSLQVARHFAFDFSLGIGYLGGKVVEYKPYDNLYIWTSTKRRHWFGPTKAEVSFVWLIGNY